MIIQKTISIFIFFVCALQSLYAMDLAEQFKRVGYVEICDREYEATTFDTLYLYFDELIEFLQTNPAWVQKLYSAKERFIRSKDRNYYSTDVFGFYDESKKEERNQISFYYSARFHEFICSRYPEFNNIPEIIRFFQACYQIQKPCGNLCHEAAGQLGLDTIFSCEHDQPPVLLKVVKYLPSYVATKPHYDGSVFSLFLDSTDNASLLLSPYKSLLTVDDFYFPTRQFSRLHQQKSILLIPGTLLTEFAIDPVPHIVISSGKVRYAPIAFAMRPDYSAQKYEHAPLPYFKD